MPNPNICGDDRIFMPDTECDACEVFEQRVEAVEADVTAIQEHLLNIYTKDEVDALIGDIEHIRMEVVTELPATGEPNVIYLLEDAQNPNKYEMYVYTTEDGWVAIGSTDIDLSNYVSNNDLGHLIAPVEGATASEAYTYNDAVIRDKKMYRVTTAIAQGQAFSTSNTEATTVIRELKHLNNVVHKTLTVAGWQVSGSEYVQTIQFNNIYSLQPDIVPCGAALGTRATTAQLAAFGKLQAIGDTATKRITFYSPEVPSTVIYLNVQGVD